MAERPLEYYLAGSYNVEVIPEDTLTGPIFLARFTSMPRCSAQGATQEEAEERLEAIAVAHITSRYKRGVELPEPDLLPQQRIVNRTAMGGGMAQRLVAVAHYEVAKDSDLKIAKVS